MTVRAARAKPVTQLPKREAILKAALTVFAEYGVHGVPVPEIAAQAGVGTGTIYRFFKSKDELVNEVYRAQKRLLGKRLTEGVDKTQTPHEVFREYWRRMVRFAREEPEAFRFLELQDHRSYLDAKSRLLERNLLVPIAAEAEGLRKRGVYRKDMPAALAMVLHWGAFVNLFKAERAGYVKLRPRDIEAACDACWRMYATDANEP
jgi:TetR/AcrR family transcriptional regulator, repressor of fatR-cypB operon